MNDAPRFNRPQPQRIGLLALAALSIVVAGGCASAPLDGGSLRSGDEQRRLNRALILAAYNGKLSEVRRLLAAGAWGDAPFGGTDAERRAIGLKLLGADKWRPLHAAVQCEDAAAGVAAAQLLLDAGVSPDVDDGYGATPLYMAIKEDHGNVAMLLLERGAAVHSFTRPYIDATEGTPLHAAIRRGNVPLVKALLAQGAYVELGDTWDNPPLQVAVGHRSLACVELLLAANADVNAHGGWDHGTALLEATKSPGDAGIIRALLAAGADVNVRLDAPISPFADEQHLREFHTPLLNAATDTPVIVHLLLSAGADTQARDEQGNTPLHLAIGDKDSTGGDPRVVRLLLAAGAYADAKNNDGDTPLHLLAERTWWDPKADLSLARSLIDAGAPVDAKNSKGQTALDLVPEDQRDAGAAQALVAILKQLRR